MSHLRLAYGKLSPEAYNGLIQTSMALSKSSLGHLVELVYLRISQINGCAFCLDMHVRRCVKPVTANIKWIFYLAGVWQKRSTRVNVQR